jgi:hypothetical protein
MTDRGRLSFNPVEGHRRYADDPEPSWYSGPDQYTPTSNPYDSGVHERPSGAFRLPEQRESEYSPSPYVTPDPVPSTGGGHSRALADPPQDQVRIPVRGPEYPTIRPSGATSLADAPSSTTYGGKSAAPAPTTYGGGSSAPVSAPGTYGGGTPAPASASRAYGGGSPAPASGVPAPASAPPAPMPGSPSGGRSAPYSDPTGMVPPVSRFAADSKPAESVYRTRRPVSAVAVAVVTVLLMVPVVMLLIRATFVEDPVARGIVPAVLLTLGLPLTGAGLYALAGGGPVGREALLRPPVAYLPVGLVLLLAAGLAVA